MSKEEFRLSSAQMNALVEFIKAAAYEASDTGCESGCCKSNSRQEEAALRRVLERQEPDKDEWLLGLEPPYREWKFVHACNDARSRRLAGVNYRRAELAGVPVEFVDCGVLYRDNNGICGICSRPVDFATFTLDHIVPLDRGGPHTRGNLQIAHAECNSRKGNR